MMMLAPMSVVVEALSLAQLAGRPSVSRMRTQSYSLPRDQAARPSEVPASTELHSAGMNLLPLQPSSTLPPSWPPVCRTFARSRTRGPTRGQTSRPR